MFGWVLTISGVVPTPVVNWLFSTLLVPFPRFTVLTVMLLLPELAMTAYSRRVAVLTGATLTTSSEPQPVATRPVRATRPAKQRVDKFFFIKTTWTFLDGGPLEPPTAG